MKISNNKTKKIATIALMLLMISITIITLVPLVSAEVTNGSMNLTQDNSYTTLQTSPPTGVAPGFTYLIFHT